MTNEALPLEVDRVSYNYGKYRALQSLSFTIQRGEFVVLLGHNGAGKTTLFSLLTGLYHPPEGRIAINGHDLIKRPSDALYQVGVVFQQRSLDIDLTVWQNVRYSANLYGLSTAEARRRAEDELDRFDMGDYMDVKIRRLSGGQSRRVEIARALVQKPNLLILDEPTVGLDVQSRDTLIQHVRRLCDEGLAVLWTTHLLDETDLDDTLCILKRGQLEAIGKGRDVTASEDKTAMKKRLTELL